MSSLNDIILNRWTQLKILLPDVVEHQGQDSAVFHISAFSIFAFFYHQRQPDPPFRATPWQWSSLGGRPQHHAAGPFSLSSFFLVLLFPCLFVILLVLAVLNIIQQVSFLLATLLSPSPCPFYI